MLVTVSRESHRVVSVAAWTDPVGHAARRRNRRWLRHHVASGRLIAVVPPNRAVEPGNPMDSQWTAARVLSDPERREGR